MMEEVEDEAGKVGFDAKKKNWICWEPGLMPVIRATGC
jgi:hypothetical protein